MDNNARSQTGQSPFDTVPKTQAASDQYNTPSQTQQGNQGANKGMFEDYFTKSANNQKSPTASSPSQTQPIQTPAPSEQKQVVQVMDEDDKDDRSQMAEQESEATELSSLVVQSSHPELLIKKELSEIVKPGPDADKKGLPDEPERLGDIPQENLVQQSVEQKDENQLPMTYGEAMLAKRKERSIKKGVSWIIREIIREWKRRFLTAKQQKPAEQTIK